MSSYYFTSESVSEGHPDKIADLVSDTVLDAILKQDQHAKVACETLVKTGMVLVAGEITTHAWVDIEALVRQTIIDIGYNHSDLGFDGHGCAILNAIGKQSPDIAMGVTQAGLDQGAGDQGIMFGYACDETDVYMPAAITYAHRLVKKQAEVRHSGELAWLRPDAKSQVTLRYVDDQPVDIDTIVLSTQHNPDISNKALQEAVIETIIKPVIPEKLRKNVKYHINPTGQFIIGGPQGDCGLTGRKIIVDTYGGAARHGGGAFSGKDPSKVDRSGAYMGRYIAKNIVASGLAKRCEVQVSYAIGVAKPTSVFVSTFGTGLITDERIAELIEQHFDLRPRAIIDHLQLLNPIYAPTAAYGHFGRQEPSFTWEKTDMADVLQDAAQLHSKQTIQES